VTDSGKIGLKMCAEVLQNSRKWCAEFLVFYSFFCRRILTALTTVGRGIKIEQKTKLFLANNIKITAEIIFRVC